VPLETLFKAWDDSTPVALGEVLRTLQQVTGAWDHEPHPSADYTGHRSVPLSESVLISWLVRGCMNWKARISGSLSVDLPVWMGDQQDEAVVIHACTESEVGDHHVYHVWVQVDPPLGQDVVRFNFPIPVAWTVGLPWGYLDPFAGSWICAFCPEQVCVYLYCCGFKHRALQFACPSVTEVRGPVFLAAQRFIFSPTVAGPEPERQQCVGSMRVLKHHAFTRPQHVISYSQPSVYT
jgi:hypothetical protein